MSFLLSVSRLIDRLSERIGHTFYWLVLATVLISAANAVVRKAFNYSSNAFLEVQWYLFSAIFLLLAGYTLLRLPLELKALFKEWLEEHFPKKATHVLSLVAQTHGGRLYDSTWSKRMTGTGPYAEVLRLRFERACRRLGFNERTMQPLDTSRFLRPARKGDQLVLF